MNVNSVCSVFFSDGIKYMKDALDSVEPKVRGTTNAIACFRLLVLHSTICCWIILEELSCASAGEGERNPQSRTEQIVHDILHLFIMNKDDYRVGFSPLVMFFFLVLQRKRIVEQRLKYVLKQMSLVVYIVY